MRTNYVNVKRALNACDRNNDGFVSLVDLRAVLSAFTIPMSEQLFKQLMERYSSFTHLYCLSLYLFEEMTVAYHTFTPMYSICVSHAICAMCVYMSVCMCVTVCLCLHVNTHIGVSAKQHSKKFMFRKISS